MSKTKPIAQMTDDEFEEYQSEKQHEELKKLLKGIIDSNKGNDKSFTDAAQSFLSKLKEFSTPNIPATIVNTDSKDVIKAINDAEVTNKKRHQELLDIGNKIYECLEQSNELRKLPVEMIPDRDHGWIKKVTVKIINPKQSKYNA